MTSDKIFCLKRFGIRIENTVFFVCDLLKELNVLRNSYYKINNLKYPDIIVFLTLEILININ